MKYPALLLATVVSLATSGCTVRAYPAAAGTVTYTYDPLYYDGYVVYYDDFGSPYYYVGGRVRYVPRTYSGYHSLRLHYDRYKPGYHRWYKREGHRHIHKRVSPRHRVGPRPHSPRPPSPRPPRVRHHR